MITDDELAVLIMRACSSRNLFIKHHFTSSHLLNNELNKRMRIWRAVRGEGSELGNSSRARGTPLARGEGSELGIWPGPKSSPKNAYRGTAAK